MYHDMVLSRILDDWLIRLQRMGKAPIHAPCKGQEATMVGTAHAVSEEDWLFPTYRELALYVAKGVPLEEIIHRWIASRDDVLKGRDLTVFGDKRYHIVPSPVPVSTQIPISVGFAMASRIRGQNIVVITFFGDGASSKGDFHEGLNIAGVFKAPVVFICQNNQWAISVNIKRQSASESIAVRAKAYGFEGEKVDGNDILAIYKAVKRAVEKVRNWEGPVLIEAYTYRLGPHTTADDPGRYRSLEEVREWEARDPIPRFRRYLERKGFWDEDKERALWKKLGKQVEETIEKLIGTSPPDVRTILEDVYARPTWNLEEQMEELLDSVEDD